MAAWWCLESKNGENMKTRQFIGILLLLALWSCGKEELLPEGLLIGSWKLRSTPSINTPTIDFYPSGVYKQVDFFSFSGSYYLSEKTEGVLKGQYSFKNNTIEFTTAHISFPDTLFSSVPNIVTVKGNAIGAILNPWKGLHSIPINTEYTPAKWKVTDLTSDELTVITPTNNTLVYERIANPN